MTYSELINRALRGRSVNRAAKDLSIPQKTLDRYVKGERLPDFDTALMLANEAGVSPGEAMLLLAHEERRRKLAKEMFAAGFRLLTSVLNRLYTRLSPA